MPTVSTPAALPSHLDELLSTRESHVEAIAVIDATLARVSTALGIPDVTATIAKPIPIAPVTAKPAAAKAMPVMAKPAPKAKVAAAKPAKAPAVPKKRGKVSKFGVSANDFVLAFVGSSKGGATTQDVNKHWKTSGRPGNADNSMSLLTKAKKLKRTPLPGGVRGSRLTLA